MAPFRALPGGGCQPEPWRWSGPFQDWQSPPQLRHRCEAARPLDKESRSRARSLHEKKGLLEGREGRRLPVVAEASPLSSKEAALA